MKTTKFIKQFPKITKQEVVSMEIMNQMEGGKCTGVCAQGCLKKNIKSNNTYPGE